jgi:hypothetical protein
MATSMASLVHRVLLVLIACGDDVSSVDSGPLDGGSRDAASTRTARTQAPSLIPDTRATQRGPLARARITSDVLLPTGVAVAQTCAARVTRTGGRASCTNAGRCRRSVNVRAPMRARREAATTLVRGPTRSAATRRIFAGAFRALRRAKARSAVTCRATPAALPYCYSTGFERPNTCNAAPEM